MTARVSCLATAGIALAQNITTGSVTGTAVDQQGGALPGVSVTAVHEPTGTQYTATTDTEGRFQIPNVRVGGPVQSHCGAERLQRRRRSRTSPSAWVRHAVSSSRWDSRRSPRPSPSPPRPPSPRPAPAPRQRQPRERSSSCRRVSRSLTDFARLSPVLQPDQPERRRFIPERRGPQQPLQQHPDRRRREQRRLRAVRLGHPGRADRRPADQPRRHPGAAARRRALRRPPGRLLRRRRQRHHQERLERLQRHGLLVRPQREPRRLDCPRRPTRTLPDTKSAYFNDTAVAAAASAVRSCGTQAFFFSNVDITRRDTPSGFAIAGGTGQSFGHQAEAQRFLDILKNNYGYDPGGRPRRIHQAEQQQQGVRSRPISTSTARHRLTVRHNYIDSVADIGFPSATQYNFPDFFYQFKDTTNSTVAQLNSVFGNRVQRGCASRYQTVRRSTHRSARSAAVSLCPGRSAGRPNLRAGTENFSVQNELDQRVIELTDDFTMREGHAHHSPSARTTSSSSSAISSSATTGATTASAVWTTSPRVSPAATTTASRTPPIPQQAARFKCQPVRVLRWATSGALQPNLTLTYGVRVDMPQLPGQADREPGGGGELRLRHGRGARRQRCSRRGPGSTGTSSGISRAPAVRGGLGLFTGRTPYVWLSNQYGNTGIDFTRLALASTRPTASPSCPIRSTSRRTSGGAGLPTRSTWSIPTTSSRRCSAATSPTTTTSASGA